MPETEKLELIGPLSVIAAIAAAEAGALALTYAPTSPFLWYLNIEVFRPVHYGLNGLMTGPQLTPFDLTDYFAAVLLILGGIAAIGKMRLAAAIASNLSLLYGLCLICGCWQANAAVYFKPSSLFTPSSALAAAILIVSIFSSAISHRSYWHAILARD